MNWTSESLDSVNIEINVVGNRYPKPRKLSPEELERLRANRRKANRSPQPDHPMPPPGNGGEGN